MLYHPSVKVMYSGVGVVANLDQAAWRTLGSHLFLPSPIPTPSLHSPSLPPLRNRPPDVDFKAKMHQMPQIPLGKLTTLSRLPRWPTSKGRQGGEGREGERMEGVGMGEEGRKRAVAPPRVPQLQI